MTTRRGLLHRHIPQALQIVAKLLKDRLTFTPEMRNGVSGFRLSGEGSFLRFLDDLVPQLSQAAASSTLPHLQPAGRLVRSGGISSQDRPCRLKRRRRSLENQC
jgi:hypothetical protein